MNWPLKVVEWSFCLLFFLVPLIFLPNTSELFEFNKIIVTYLLTIVIVSSWIMRMVLEKRFIFRRTLLDIPLVIFLVATLLSLIFSIDIHTSWYGYYSRWNGGFLSLLSYVLLYWSFVSNMDSKSSWRVVTTSLISAILVSLWGVAEHFGADAHLWVQDVKTRVFSTLGQPNWLAAYLVTLIYIPVAIVMDKKTQRSEVKTILNVVVWSLIFITLLFTKSRSGILAFAFTSAIFWSQLLLRDKFKNIANIMYGLAFTGAITILTLVIPNPVRDLVFHTETVIGKNTGTVLEVGGTESGNIRKIVWTGAIRIWQASTKNFLVGAGPETFAMAYYQHRPIEHNQTSEWELLYNKAHNEFLNQLATTGILGMTAYLVLLFGMLLVILKSPKHLLIPALIAGWLTIPITNFWGFSVVMVQLLMFLIPALAVTLTLENKSVVKGNVNMLQLVAWIILVSVASIPVVRYWLADTKLAAGQNELKYFQATQNPQYLVTAQENMVEAYKLNKGEPVIASELSNSAAYLSMALAASSTSSAEQLAQVSVVASDQALQKSPTHPNYYKSRARSFILLSDLDPQFLALAADTLEKAMVISPTDPRLPHNLGVVYKFLGEEEKAKQYFENSLKLKPDFADPREQLEELSSGESDDN